MCWVEVFIVQYDWLPRDGNISRRNQKPRLDNINQTSSNIQFTFACNKLSILVFGKVSSIDICWFIFIYCHSYIRGQINRIHICHFQKLKVSQSNWRKLQQMFKIWQLYFLKLICTSICKNKTYKDIERLPWCNLRCKLTGTERSCCILRNSCVNHHHNSLSAKFYQTHFSHLNRNDRKVHPTSNVSSIDSKNSTETKSVLYELLSLKSMP